MKVLYGFTAPQSARAFLRGQIEFLLEQGFSVDVASTPGMDLADGSLIYGARFHPLPMEREISLKSELPSLIAWIRLLRTIRPDVVNVGTPKAALLGMIASSILRTKKRVYVVRGLRFEGEIGLKRGLLLAIERFVCFLATDVVVVSESVAHELKHNGVKARLLLIGDGSSNGVDYARWNNRIADSDRDELRRTLEIPDSSFVCLFVGRVTPDKGANALADMLDHCAYLGTDVTLVIVGRTESSDAAVLELLSNPNVRHAEYSENIELYYSFADLLVLPTRREGFPNVVLEAAASGLPTITTNATGAKDSVIDGVTGFVVEVDDGESIARRVSELAIDRGHLAAMARAAQERAATSFRPERIWRGLASIYRGSPNGDVRIV